MYSISCPRQKNIMVVLLRDDTSLRTLLFSWDGHARLTPSHLSAVCVILEKNSFAGFSLVRAYVLALRRLTISTKQFRSNTAL